MAIITICDENRILRDYESIREHLASIDIEYERWDPSHAVASRASSEEILSAYSAEIEKLKQSGGYIVADVIDVTPETTGLDQMLAKFNREHWHDEDEVRFIIDGRGVFHIRPSNDRPITAIEVEPGDLICVPRGTMHWFNLCSDRRIRAIRLFQDPSGWTPHYSDSGVDVGYQPVCLGSSYLPLHSTPV